MSGQQPPRRRKRARPRKGASRTSSPSSTSSPSISAASPASPPQSDGDDTSGVSSLDLLAKVRSGEINGKALSASDRQLLVLLLTNDGVSNPEIAKILQVSDRTVERDRRAIRESIAIQRDPNLVNQLLGRLMAEGELTIQRIRRIARGSDVNPAARMEGEARCFGIMYDLLQAAQRVGFIPSATHKVEAELTHHTEEVVDLDELQLEMARLQQVEKGPIDASTPPKPTSTPATKSPDSTPSAVTKKAHP